VLLIKELNTFKIIIIGYPRSKIFDFTSVEGPSRASKIKDFTSMSKEWGYKDRHSG
jgi:hypothetical protein